MIFPIVAYGHPTLRKKAEPVNADTPGLQEFIKDLWETMYATDGIGLAAPQVNRSIRVFVIDTDVLSEKFPEAKGFKKAFINPQLLEEIGNEWAYSEGCLSIPDIHEDVYRKPRIHLRYQDENFIEHDEWSEGIVARVIQHEYDHLEGILFTDKLSPLRKTMLSGKLNNIARGRINPPYRMVFASPKKK